MFPKRNCSELKGEASSIVIRVSSTFQNEGFKIKKNLISKVQIQIMFRKTFDKFIKKKTDQKSKFQKCENFIEKYFQQIRNPKTQTHENSKWRI